MLRRKKKDYVFLVASSWLYQKLLAISYPSARQQWWHMDTLKFYECEPDRYLYENVIITPFFSPGGSSSNPSLIGNISINKPYTDHFKFSKIASRRCHYAAYEEEINDTVIFGGFLFDAYGHFILESLSFMWFIQYLDKQYDIYFAFDPSGECILKNYQIDVFKNLNVTNRIFLSKKQQFFVVAIFLLQDMHLAASLQKFKKMLWQYGRQILSQEKRHIFREANMQKTEDVQMRM